MSSSILSPDASDADAQVLQVQAQMADIRRQLDTEVEAVRESADQLMDWKHYARNYPWFFVAAATAVGFAAVPRRLEVLRPDPDTIAQLAKSNRLVVTEHSETQTKPGLGTTLFHLLSNSLLRAGTAYLGQQLGAWGGHKAAEPDREEHPGP